MPRTLEDCALGERIVQHLRSRYGEHGRLLRIELQDGQVVLRGEAQSFYQKQLWLRSAAHVAGGEGLVDLIEVCDGSADTWHE